MKAFSLRSTVLVSLLLTLHVGFVISQTGSPSTTAQCYDEYEWMYNTKDQSPCLVAAYLQSTCFTNGAWAVPALQPGAVYVPPDSSQVNPCQCNTITYNMLSACGACQKRGWVGFRTWVAACPEGVVQVQTYPFRIQSETALPAWAYLDTSAGTFDVNQAYHIARNTTDNFTTDMPKGGISTGAVVAIVVIAILVLAIPLMYFIFRRRGTLNPWSTRSIDGETTPVRVQPVRMKSMWMAADDHKYSPIQKVSSRTSPVASLFSPAGRLGRIRGSRSHTPMLVSERPTSKFEIDKDTVIQAGGGGSAEDGLDTRESTPALGHRRNDPSAGGVSNSSWQSFLRINGPRPPVEQHEDIGSAVDFTFVSSNANNNAEADEEEAAGPSRDPSPDGRGPYSWWSRNPAHKYPPIARKSTDLSTIYPSDSISNLQLRENLEQIPSQGEQSPFTLGRPPQGRNTPNERREAERARQEEEMRRELAALEVMSPLGTESSIHTEKYSPPPHRSRLPQVPSSDPVMMYPVTVRGNVPHTPVSR